MRLMWKTSVGRVYCGRMNIELADWYISNQNVYDVGGWRKQGSARRRSLGLLFPTQRVFSRAPSYFHFKVSTKKLTAGQGTENGALSYK